jgi:putative oxidoreductase
MKYLVPLLALRDRIVPPAHTALSLVLRVVFGWQFFLTGRGKLTHLDRTTEFFASLNLPAPGFHAVFVGSLELAGGLLILAGLGTRAVSGVLAGIMIVAYATAHRAEALAGLDGFTAAAPFPFLFATLVLAVHGAGPLSLDAVWVKRSCTPARPAAG